MVQTPLSTLVPDGALQDIVNLCFLNFLRFAQLCAESNALRVNYPGTQEGDGMMKPGDPSNVQVYSDMRARVRKWYYLVILSSFIWLFWVLLFVFYSIAIVGSMSM
jgi:hypothetical protein